MKLNYKRTFFVGLAFMSISAFWQMYDNVVPLILDRTFHMGETITGAIMALDNVLALILLPVFGTLSDKVNTKLGRRTPFILVGTTLAILFMSFLPMADNQGNLILFLVALGLVLLSMGSYRSPAVALMPDLTPKPLRSKANAIINLMGTVGGIYTLLMIMLLVPDGDHPNYTALFVSVAALMVVAVGLLLITVRENKLREEKQALEARMGLTEEVETKEDGSPAPLAAPVKRSLIFILMSIVFWFMAYNAVTTAFSRYAINVWGLQGGGYANCLLVATGAAMVSYIPIGIVSSKIGRKRTILIGISLLILSFGSGILFQEFHPIINLVFAITGIGWASINVNSYPMVVEMSKNADVGKYTGLYYTFSMAAQIITPVISGMFLEHISYRTLFPYAMAFSVLAFCTMMQVRHGDNRPEKEGEKHVIG